MKLMLSIILLAAAVAGVQAADAWQLIREKNNIKIYASQKPSHKLKHHRGQTLINQDADTILAALQDTSACAEWVYQCISSRMVSMTDVSERVYHTTIDSPLWFKKRDFYLQSDAFYDSSTQQFTITLTSIPDYAAVKKDAVRLSDVAMVWQLKTVEPGTTEVIYEVYVDPKLPIKSLNHKMIRRSIIKTMQGLTELVKKPEYAEIKYSESELQMLESIN